MRIAQFLLLVTLFVGFPPGKVSLSISPCENLCTINKTSSDKLNECLKLCSESLENSDKDSELINPDKTLENDQDEQKSRMVRSSDTSAFLGPYQRRPHYLRIGRSAEGPEPSEEPEYEDEVGSELEDEDDNNKEVRDVRSKPSHYMRIGRDGAEINNDEKRARPSHYMRIGRGGDEVDKRSRQSQYMRIGRDVDGRYFYISDKKSRPSHYLRIGRAGDQNLSSEETENLSELSEMGDEDSEIFEAGEKRSKPSHYLRIGKSKPSHYLRIGRAKPSHYLRIGKSKPSHYLRIGKSKPSHYLRIGRGGSEQPSSYLDDDAMVPEEAGVSAGLRTKRDAARIYRKSHYLRIGRA